MLRFIPILIFLALIGGFAWQMYSDYQAMPPEDKADWKNKLWALGKGSATKFWMRLVAIGSAVVGFLANTADYFQLPQVSDAINKYLKPEYVPIAFVIVGIIGIWARNRTTDNKSWL